MGRLQNFSGSERGKVIMEEREIRLGTRTWKEPLPLFSTSEAKEYPVEALPETIREAVKEVIGFVQAPIPLAASSALGALSLAAQGLIDVERAKGLSGPCSLFFLTMAESGERKSSCDGYFTKEIKGYEKKKKKRNRIYP